MGTYNSAVITNGGQSMIAQAVAGASLEFTVIKTSNYAYPAGTNLATLTTINGIKQSKDITGAAVYNSRVIKISAAVDNTGISTAYTINTIGIYAKVGSSAESLFAVVTASAADTMPAYDSKPYSYIYEISLTMQNAANVTVTVNAAGLVNVAGLNAAKVEIQGEIADLKSDLSRLDDLSFKIENNSMPVDWFERGSISSGANDTYRSGSRARTKNMLRFNSMIAVTVTSGYFLIAYYNANNTWTSNSGWKTSADTIAISKNQRFRIVVSLNNGAPASQTDALADMVGILVFKTDATENRFKNVLNVEFEHGSLNLGANDTYNQNARCRTVEICQFPFDVDVSMKNGSYSIHFFDEFGTYTNKTTWITTDKYRISAYTKFRLLLADNIASNVYADLSDMVENLDIEILQSNVPTSACPNIIFQCRNVNDDYIPPESIWYVKESARNQYDRVRFTYRKTSDGYYFNCHDDVINNVARNMDGTEISTSISANGQTLATLNSYDWGIKYGSKYAGAKVPLLEDGMKYAALFNLGVTLHSSTALYETDEDVQNLLAMIDKYGLTDNLIVVTGNGHNFTTMQKYLAHNPRISYYIGGEASFFADSNNINSIKALQTGFNKIYVQIYPWGTTPTGEFIALAKTNNFVIYDSITMSESDLLNLDTFNKGYGLMEVNNVYNIKDTIRNWANSLID